ncbi:TRAPP trafficking subunit Trs65-domain-containing protein [Fusarium redolens]|uniref:TRAPP trafficking subunit Trs65-domain-containing protein n=1 Tax=Fusarium redolens TaxID=48865 RepID=A0A9P9KR43_FUSRE|nr:TRAPP trafficking subunit Trs65-domain-containing protein [Fusarium redolens]KAH7266984.1 TRAPP trafficking subunit Trs65-domain-containing protein [Fusarium redolens]
MSDSGNTTDRESIPPEATQHEPESLTQLKRSLFITDPTTEFAEQSHLSYLIPESTNLDLEAAFKDVEPGKSILDSIKRRDTLFFDETVNVLLLLRSPWKDEASLRTHLNRLVISVEAQIVNSKAHGKENSTADTIFSGTVPDIDDPFIIVDGEEEEEVEEDSDDSEESGDDANLNQSVFAVWKLPVFLSRPRTRISAPAIIFTASASMKPEVSTDLIGKGSGYLQSGVPSGFNLLESFGSDAALGGVKPRLSALRVSRVTPVTRSQDVTKHIRALPQVQHKIFPVVHTRIRFSRPTTAPTSSAVIALLEVDFTSHFECEVSLDQIELSILDATVENLNNDAGMQLPLTCVSHDHITFLYRIAPRQHDVTVKNPMRELDIKISATAQVIPGHCTPSMNMSWTTQLDFTLPVNPGYGSATAGTGIVRAHRPSQLSITGQAVNPLVSPSIIRPDALPTLEAATSNADASITELGITMTFTGPSEPVYPGQVFSWTVYIVNRATDKNPAPPRKLALVAIPKRRRGEVRMTRPPSVGGRRHGEKDVADAVTDENVLHALQKNSSVESTDVVCLSADTRVGPLAPGACHVVELQFLALQEGVVGLEAMRVVDLGSQEHVDIRDLPTMLVEPAAA